MYKIPCLEHTYINQKKYPKSSEQSPPFHSQDLIVIPLLRLFEKSLSFLQAFFYLTVILAVFCCSLIVLNSWNIKNAG